MRLLINAIPLLGEESGIGNYTRQIASAVASASADFDLTFFYGYPSRRLVPEQRGNYGSWLGSLRGLARKASIARRIGKKILYLANKTANAVRPRVWDCYFEPNFILLPTLRAEHKIIAVHDFSCFRYPEWHPADRVRHMEKFFWQSVAQADRIITVSDAIRSEGIKMFNIPADKITTIPNGVDHRRYRPAGEQAIASLRSRYGLPGKFILYVGALEPRKNLINLLKAHAQLPQKDREEYPLLLIGSQGWNNAEIMDSIRRQAPCSRLLGYVPSDDLPAFYSAATFFAYPSWYEGFGLPALEAMACGRAVLTSTDPAVGELCAGASLVAAPDDVDGMAKHMERLLHDDQLRAGLEQAALKKAAAYSWNKSARAHMDLFRQTAC